MSPQDAERLKTGDSIHFCRDRGFVLHAPGVQGVASTGVQVGSRGAYRVLCLLTPGKPPALPAVSPPGNVPTPLRARSDLLLLKTGVGKFLGEDKELDQSVRGGLRAGVQESLRVEVRLLQASLQGHAARLRPSLRTLRPDLKNFHKAHSVSLNRKLFLF